MESEEILRFYLDEPRQTMSTEYALREVFTFCWKISKALQVTSFRFQSTSNIILDLLSSFLRWWFSELVVQFLFLKGV